MMMASATKENIETDESGQYLPATQRPDGTWRKPRKVKPGYVPQEEVPLYESKGKQWVNSKPRLPPGVYEDPSPAKVEDSKALSKAAKKNEKRRQKRKEKQTETEQVQNGDVEQLRKGVQEVSVGGGADFELVVQDPQKRIKNLKKKIRQIEELEAKIANGEVAQPSKEQLEKIARKEALVDELDSLEDGS